jgi:hypothetical protein
MRSFVFRFVFGLLAAAPLAVTVCVLSSCSSSSTPTADAPPTDASIDATPRPTGNQRLQTVVLNDITAPSPVENGLTLSAARNEWTSFNLQLAPLPAGDEHRTYSLQIRAFTQAGVQSGVQTAGQGQISADNCSAYQILAMPVDVNRAGYVRHTGLSASDRLLPRALLPMKSAHGMIPLSSLRDPTRPGNPQATAAGSDQPTLLWIDLHIPAEAPAGDYSAACDLIEDGQTAPLATTPLRLHVHDFVLPDERHLMMVGRLDWSDLTRLYPDRFEAVTPRRVNRTDDRYHDAVRTLDDLQALAQQNRTQLWIPRLQPTVSWPAGAPPRIFWDDYDSLVSPWIKGDLFPDKIPLGYWPLPEEEHLQNYDPGSQLQYWKAVAAHFDQLDWLDHSAVVLDPNRAGGRADTLESVKLSADAAAILRLNNRLRVTVPLEDDQIAFASDATPSLITPDIAPRLLTANPGLVFAAPERNWPDSVPRPHRWLRTDLRGLIPYVGAGGDERDVRVWAWLASLPLPPPQMGMQYGPVQFVQWAGTLPKTSTPREPADPNDLIWFYPGSWFGVDQPVPTLQLKWLRRAQQDFEYIYLARQRGDTINPLLMARLVTKPVELAPDQNPDPTYGLMCGTADPKAWSEATDLLAGRILLREPGQTPDKAKRAELQDRENNLNLETLRWGEPQERPVIMGRSAEWLFAPPAGGMGPPGVDLRLGIDIYNASDRTPDENSLQWSDGPAGWHWRPQPISVPQLATYRVRRFTMNAHVETSELNNTDRKPNVLTFVDGFTRQQSVVQMMLPVAISERREGRLTIDGNLDDWSAEDAIQNGPLVTMFNRPALQSQQLQLATTPTSIFTGWADENFYIAFKVSGIAGGDLRATRNWVAYEFRRAWGEDLCQILIEAVYADGSIGPMMHVALKPNGTWVERKLDPHLFADPWQAFEGTGLRYAATIDNADWRGEVAIPWKAICDPSRKDRPVMLRFNFSQHKTATGESASWAGPIDFGRDDQFMGLLFLREQDNPGMQGPDAP